jgi:propanol-preferring alcohol dehydrogenase
VAGAVTVRGSFVGTRKDMAECLDFAAKGKVKADIELQPLSSINTIFDRLDHGDVPSRVVLDFTDTHSERGADQVRDSALAVPVIA